MVVVSRELSVPVAIAAINDRVEQHLVVVINVVLVVLRRCRSQFRLVLVVFLGMMPGPLVVWGAGRQRQWIRSKDMTCRLLDTMSVNGGHGFAQRQRQRGAIKGLAASGLSTTRSYIIQFIQTYGSSTHPALNLSNSNSVSIHFLFLRHLPFISIGTYPRDLFISLIFFVEKK